MPVGNIIHHTINESVGKLLENLAHEDAKTRQHMERIAKYVPKGSCLVSEEVIGAWLMGASSSKWIATKA
jgi:hypothetical protein